MSSSSSRKDGKPPSSKKSTTSSAPPKKSSVVPPGFTPIPAPKSMSTPRLPGGSNALPSPLPKQPPPPLTTKPPSKPAPAPKKKYQRPLPPRSGSVSSSSSSLPPSDVTDTDDDFSPPPTPVSAPDLEDYGNHSDGGIHDPSQTNFTLLQSVQIDKSHPDNEVPSPPIRVDMWRSSVTGFTVVKADAPGPLLHASWHVQVPNRDNRGIPSALLDMIDATGTSTDPQKDFLNVLGSRLMSSGVDITGSLTTASFKLQSASADGLLDMLPPVFERILHPDLSNEVFTSEVHHVDGDGRDGGRAYLRSQEVEKKMSRVMSEA